MLNVDIEKCLYFVSNKFELVLIASNRARDLVYNNAKPLIKFDKDKATVIALKEIETGKNITLIDRCMD